jgi:Protein of unknown function (DUF3102)
MTRRPPQEKTTSKTNTRTLPQIAKAIKAEEKKNIANEKHSVANTIKIGGMLEEANEQCDHGQWGNWLKKNFGHWSHTQSQRYRDVYALSQIPQIGEFVKNLSVSAAYRVAELGPDDPGTKALIKAARKGHVSHALAQDILDDLKKLTLTVTVPPREPDPVAISIGALVSKAQESYEDSIRHQVEAHQRLIKVAVSEPEVEQVYTGLIKNRELYEGACELPWAQYFEYRDSHPDDVAPLTPDDLAYVGQWTSAAPAPPVDSDDAAETSDNERSDADLELAELQEKSRLYLHWLGNVLRDPKIDLVDWQKVIKDVSSEEIRDILYVLKSKFDQYNQDKEVQAKADAAERR